jgi:PAP2 superfamily protein
MFHLTAALSLLLAFLPMRGFAVAGEPSELASTGESAAVAASPDSAAFGASTAATRPPGIATRATRTVRAFASDVGYVVASPTRLRTKGLLLTVGAIGATALTYGYDNEIQRAAIRNRENDAYGAVVDVGQSCVDVGFMGGTWPYWVGGAVVGTTFKIRPLQSVCLDVIESHLISGGARNLAKFAIGRKHPFEADRSSFFEHGTSMPSGHTSVVFELATIFTRHTKGMPTAARVAVGTASYGIATAIAVQRVDSNAHWASDVVLGGVSGAVIANTVVNRNQERRERESLTSGPTLTPGLGASGQPTLAMVWRF